MHVGYVWARPIGGRVQRQHALRTEEGALRPRSLLAGPCPTKCWNPLSNSITRIQCMPDCRRYAPDCGRYAPDCG
eukprot:4336607-Pyramimonas_sp.AAC.1